MPSDDTARFLAGSPDRRRLLERLSDDPGSPAELADALSAARRSVQRNLAEFADRGWAEKVDGAYRLTVTGELVADEHADYLDSLDRIEAFEEFYRYLPDRDHAPDPRRLADASLTAASSTDPQAPVHRYVEVVRAFDTDRVRMVSPVLSRLFHEAHAQLAFDGVHTDLVMSAETVERAREMNPAEFAAVTSVGVLDLYRHPGPVEVGLTLGDDRLVVCAYDGDGALRACVESADPSLLRWGADLFERYRDEAERVEPPFSLPFGD